VCACMCVSVFLCVRVWVWVREGAWADMSDERPKDRVGWRQSEGTTRYYKVRHATLSVSNLITRVYVSIRVSLITCVYVSILVSLMTSVYYCLTCVYAPLPKERAWSTSSGVTQDIQWRHTGHGVASHRTSSGATQDMTQRLTRHLPHTQGICTLMPLCDIQVI